MIPEPDEVVGPPDPDEVEALTDREAFALARRYVRQGLEAEVAGPGPATRTVTEAGGSVDR